MPLSLGYTASVGCWRSARRSACMQFWHSEVKIGQSAHHCSGCTALDGCAARRGRRLGVHLRRTTPAPPPLTVRLLQGNIEQSLKFERAGIHAALTQYIKLITARPADLIVTPETALPIRVHDI